MSDFKFDNPDAENLYHARVTLIRDVTELKVPTRVPVFLSEGFFPILHAGVTMKDALYDYDEVEKAITEYYTEFEPNAWHDTPEYVPGKAYDILCDVCCIAGNVPASLMAAGSPGEVREYFKNQIEIAGKGGGFRN